MEVFFVISYLNHKWDIELFLKIFIENEWKHVSKMKSLRWWASTCIQIERREIRITKLNKWLRVFFISSKNKIQIPMREENISCKESMRLFISDFFNSFKQCFVHMITSELINEFIVIDLFSCGIGNHVRVNNNLFIRFVLWILVYLWFILFAFNGMMSMLVLMSVVHSKRSDFVVGK